jgi:hypothetical protein
MGQDLAAVEAVEDWIDEGDRSESASRDNTVSVLKVV